MLYLLNFQYNIYNYFATCFDSSELSSGVRFKTYCMYCFIVLCFKLFFLLQKGSLFLHYKPESMSIWYWGGGLVVVLSAHFPYFGGWGFFRW